MRFNELGYRTYDLCMIRGKFLLDTCLIALEIFYFMYSFANSQKNDIKMHNCISHLKKFSESKSLNFFFICERNYAKIERYRDQQNTSLSKTS